jgi:DNA-binding NtrC family response regulator
MTETAATLACRGPVRRFLASGFEARIGELQHFTSDCQGRATRFLRKPVSHTAHSRPQAGKKFRTIDKKSLRLLQAYDWPGNIRELQNVIERAVIQIGVIQPLPKHVEQIKISACTTPSRTDTEIAELG